MFIQTWKKYLPVIVFLMKRAIKREQVLDMNLIDFERATGGKKVKLNFPAITLSNGRVDYDGKYPDLVANLLLVLKESESAGILMQYQQFNFSMNLNCQLMISNTTPFISLGTEPYGG